jgi:hypothetical protein
MVNRLEEESSLSRLRDVLDGVQGDRLPDSRSSWESDLREVRRRLARLRLEFPGLATQVELNIDLVKAGERLDGRGPGGRASGSRVR